MNTKMLATVALVAFAVSAVPAAAAFDGPLSPSGGQREANNGPSNQTFGTFDGQSQNLVIEGADAYAGSMTYEDKTGGSLSRNGSDR